MHRIIRSNKDAYITNKVIKGKRKHLSNTGASATLDLFKLYGASFDTNRNPNTEISRLLVHFDLATLRDLVSRGKIDISDPSFTCKLHLRDVYGGQPTPSNFTITLHPLSSSFTEGQGKDVSYYSDYDTCNWLSSSLTTTWVLPGCSQPCDSRLGGGDYITSSLSFPTTIVTQSFPEGSENGYLDVTKLVSGTITGELPDQGWRISLSPHLEENNETYFVKRFSSRNAFDEGKHPTLTVGYDDSIGDDSQSLMLDSSGKINLYNYDNGVLTHILSGSLLTPLTGTNCISLKLSMEIPGGTYDLYFSGSQFSYGSGGRNPLRGVYTSTVSIPYSTPVVKTKVDEDGFVKFSSSWISNDRSVVFSNNEIVTLRPPDRTGSRRIMNYTVNTTNVRGSYPIGVQPIVRLNIFDGNNPIIKLTKLPSVVPGLVVKGVYWRLRDSLTGEIIIPFDEIGNSTKVSSDTEGMFFNFDTTGLILGRTYVFDSLISQNDTRTLYQSVSPIFSIE